MSIQERLRNPALRFELIRIIKQGVGHPDLTADIIIAALEKELI
jgi:S-adenosylmethionine synthetase